MAIQFTQLVTELTDTRDYDIILVGFNFTNDPDQSQLFSSSGIAVGGFNGMDFTNSEIDKLLNEGTRRSTSRSGSRSTSSIRT